MRSGLQPRFYMLCGALVVSLLCSAPAMAAKSTISPELRQVAGEIALLARDIGPTSVVFNLLREAQPVFQAEFLLPRQYLIECRRGRTLAVLVGSYRANASYARAYASEVIVPLKQSMATLDLSEEAGHALEYAWAVDGGVEARVAGARVRQGVKDAVMGLQNMNDARTILDIFYGLGLEIVHIVMRTALSLDPEGQTGVSMGPALAETVRCLDLFRRQLQGWTERPDLVREWGIFSQLSMLDRLQVDVELFINQPSRTLAERILGTVNEIRAGVATVCPMPSSNEKSPHRNLLLRDDLFKPRNFF